MAAGPVQRLTRAEFNQPTLKVARSLIGKFLVRRIGRLTLSAMITEVEAYKGPRDLAAHSARGRRTARIEPLYGDGGTVYVYFIYGIHWMLNFATAGKDLPEGVLIRGILADVHAEVKYLAGPGRVTQYLKVDKSLDGKDATLSRQIWIEDRGLRVPARSIRRGPRIGVDYSGEYWAARPWRFWLDKVAATRISSRQK
ncbi:MAG TPA: DNA-3-methyladenine glycosylase [Burkholderiales bacterium]